MARRPRPLTRSGRLRRGEGRTRPRQMLVERGRGNMQPLGDLRDSERAVLDQRHRQPQILVVKSARPPADPAALRPAPPPCARG
jgi:hypothetical protein